MFCLNFSDLGAVFVDQMLRNTTVANLVRVRQKCCELVAGLGRRNLVMFPTDEDAEVVHVGELVGSDD